MSQSKQRPMTPPTSNTNELVQHQFSQLAHFNANTPFSRGSPAQREDRSQYLGTPQSGYPTPAAMYQEDHYTMQQPEYTYSQADVGLGLPNELYDFPQHSQPLRRYPAPPTPQYQEAYRYTASPTPSNSDAIRTRSGLAVQRTVRPSVESKARVTKTKAPRQKKNKAKAEKKADKLTEPLSVLTKDYEHVPVVDIDAYVNRSAEVRLREIEEGKQPGKVKRPMNSFMLYRKAYQNRTKNFCLENNHQVVSQVCGDSWPLEPDAVREQFNEWARIERTNHQNAHPGYKFSPSKPGQSKKDLKRKISETPEDSEESDLEDWDYKSGRHIKRARKFGQREQKVDPDDAYRPSSEPYGYSSRNSSMEPNAYNPSSYQATNPGKPLPAQYATHLQPDHYYQQMVRQGPLPGTEDVKYNITSTPGPQYMDHVPQSYITMPQYSQQQTMYAPQHIIDPALFAPDGSYRAYQFPTPGSTYNDSGTMNPGHLHNEAYTSAPQQYTAAIQATQLLRNDQDQWQVSSIDPDTDFEDFWKTSEVAKE